MITLQQKREFLKTMSNPLPAQQPSQMQSVAAAASIGERRVIHSVDYAITGDIETDFIAGIIAVFDTLSREPNVNAPQPAFDNRMGQRVCEYLARRFQSQAEEIEKQAQFVQELSKPFGGLGAGQHSSPPNMSPNVAYSDSTAVYPAPEPRITAMQEAEARRRFLTESKALVKHHSGTHSPSTHLPASTGGSGEPDVSAPDWHEDGSVMSGPPPMGWPVDDKM